MILITQTDKKQYHAVEVPVDASKIEPLANGIIFTSNGNSKSIRLWELSGKFEIIGIQGGGDSLSTEQAFEILQYAIMGDWIVDEDPVKTAVNYLKSLGIETENPYKKPIAVEYGMDAYPYSVACEVWEQAESKLKRVVIIKSEI